MEKEFDFENEVLELIKAIPDVERKLGETIADKVAEEEFYEIGHDVLQVFADCKTDDEFNLVNRMLMTTCGYFFETLVEMIQKRDDNGYNWKCF